VSGLYKGDTALCDVSTEAKETTDDPKTLPPSTRHTAYSKYKHLAFYEIRRITSCLAVYYRSTGNMQQIAINVSRKIVHNGRQGKLKWKWKRENSRPILEFDPRAPSP